MTTKLTGSYSAVSAAAAVVSTQSAAEFDGMLLDLWTASAIVALHSALNPTNAAKLAAMPLEKAATLALKLTGKGK